MYSKSELFNAPMRRGIIWKAVFGLCQALNPFPEEVEAKVFLDEVANFIVNVVSLYPPLVKLSFIAGLLLFEFHTIFFKLKRVSKLKIDERLRIFKRWLYGKGIIRDFARAFLAITNSAFFEHPYYMRKVGYPWV